MLEREHGGGHEHERLVPLEHHPEGRAHGHLGLAEAHVAHHEAVHRRAGAEVG